MAVVTSCPECGHRLKLGARPHIGQRRMCPKCNANLKIVSLSPPELDIYDIHMPSPRTTEKKKTMAEAFCPECGHSLKLGTHPRKGQQAICPECGMHLEVVDLNPLELDISIDMKRQNKE